MAFPDPRAVKLAETAIDAFNAIALLEGDDDILLWHLIINLRHYAVARGLDFDVIAAETLPDFARERQEG
jgi:hypothetical protein